MTAVNKDPFVYSKSKDGKPSVFLGLVQAGADQAIKIGEICTFNETTGYWVPVDAVADSQYKLAIAKEEQKASGRAELTASRYIEFYSLSPDDIFEFDLDAARSLAIGDTFTLTDSNSQKLTYSAAAFPVAINVGWDYYPQEEDTTIRNQSYARVRFNPAVTYYGYHMDQTLRAGRKFITVATATTLIETDMFNSVILMGGVTVTLPAVKSGMDAIFIVTSAASAYVDPNASDKIRLAGAQLDNGDKLASGAAAGDTVQLISEDADGFCAIVLEGTWTDGS